MKKRHFYHMNLLLQSLRWWLSMTLFCSRGKKVHPILTQSIKVKNQKNCLSKRKLLKKIHGKMRRKNRFLVRNCSGCKIEKKKLLKLINMRNDSITKPFPLFDDNGRQRKKYQRFCNNFQFKETRNKEKMIHL